MPKIADQRLRRVKTEIDLVDLVQSQGIELKAHGKDLIGLCPFHDDRTPSLVITPKMNLWHCMGACSSGGGVIDWTMKIKNVEFLEAVKILSNKLNGKTVSLVKPATVKSSPSKPILNATAEDSSFPRDQKLLKRVIDYYRERLKETPRALGFLKSRGLVHPDLVEKFKLGYCDRTLVKILPKTVSEEGKKIRHRLRKTGLYKGKGHELFNGCVTFPVLDMEGNISEIYGRRIKDDTRLSSHLYMPGAHSGVFNLQAFAEKELIYCESIIDALSFWVHGFKNVTAIYGTGGFTQDHRTLLEVRGIKKVTIAFDNDEAGNRATQKIGEQLFEMGITCFRINLPYGLDINETMLLQNEFDERKETLSVLLKQAKRLSFKVTETTTEAKTKAAKKEKVSLKTAMILKESETALGSVQEKSEKPAGTDPVKDGDLEVKGEEVFARFGDRQYRIRGLFRNLSFEVLRINIRVFLKELYYLDSLDLYQAKARSHFIKHAAVELGLKETVVKTDLGKLLLKLEELQFQEIEKQLDPAPVAIKLNQAEEKEALEFLKSESLLETIAQDFETCGLIGEKQNALLGYLAVISRKMEKPLAVIIQSSSSAGKSTLMDAILQFLPEEELQRYTAMTGQSLFYMGENDLVHKTLAISEEEGAERASYAIKTMQSERCLNIASTGKDPKTGRLETQHYKVNGPVQIMMTTTNVDLDEELENRCFVLAVDESREQTAAIHQRQRTSHTLSGLRRKRKRERILRVHQNAGRLLKSLDVINPFADRLTFPTHRLRLRRDHEKYLSLILAVAFLHQHGRREKSDSNQPDGGSYIEVELSDIEIANTLCKHVLNRSLDELLPQTRRLLKSITQMVKETAIKSSMEPGEVRFTRRQLRQFTGLSDYQVHIHLNRLVKLEYLGQTHVVGSQRFVYELLYGSDSETDPPVLVGLIDTERLKLEIQP